MAAAVVGDSPFAHLFHGLLFPCCLVASMVVSTASSPAFAVAGREEIAGSSVGCLRAPLMKPWSGVTCCGGQKRVWRAETRNRERGESMGSRRVGEAKEGRVGGCVVDVAGCGRRRGCPRQLFWWVGEAWSARQWIYFYLIIYIKQKQKKIRPFVPSLEFQNTLLIFSSSSRII